MKRKCAVLLMIFSTMLMTVACSDAGTKPAASAQPGVEEAVGTAVDAYVYGYSLVTMDMTRRQLTNVAAPDATHAPMGQILRIRTYPPVDIHTVTAPNADTLYTTAWMDVSKEPWILSRSGHGRPLLPVADARCWMMISRFRVSALTGERRTK